MIQNEHEHDKEAETQRRRPGAVSQGAVNASHLSDIVRNVISGKEQVVSYAGTSQYALQGRGISACCLAALNFSRLVLTTKEQGGLRDESLLRDVISQQSVEEYTAICLQWSSNLHLEVEEIYRVPIFEHSLTLVSSKYDQPGFTQFRELLLEMRSVASTCAAVITRPPEIIACLKIQIAHSRTDVFIIFDSHSRPLYPNGAGLICNGSLDATANRLSDLLSVDRQLFAEGGMQWQAQLLANFSAHVFVARGDIKARQDPSVVTQTVLQSSLAILRLRAEIADLKYQNSSLAADNQRLEADVEKMDEECREAKRKLEVASRHRSFSSRPHSSGQSQSPGTVKKHSPEIARPSQSSSFDHRRVHSPSLHKADHHDSDKPVSLHASSTPSVSAKGKERARPNEDTAPQHALDYDLAEYLAFQKQCEYQDEDARLSAERQELARAFPSAFTCGVCLDQHPDDSVARVGSCAHEFCRDCLRGHIRAKLGEHRFPIHCPMCMTEKEQSTPGIISESLILQIGVTEAEYALVEEMQLAALSILLHCRKCKRSVFVDRSEYQESKVIACPLPHCNYVWCKACQQEIAMAGPPHSCDGSSELEHLMESRGWKHCPGCTTPIQKDSGCNHMTCMSPGCNTHFCYICGMLIVKSALQREIKSAVSAHYRVCKLFEYGADRGLPP